MSSFSIYNDENFSNITSNNLSSSSGNFSGLSAVTLNVAGEAVIRGDASVVGQLIAGEGGLLVVGESRFFGEVNVNNSLTVARTFIAGEIPQLSVGPPRIENLREANPLPVDGTTLDKNKYYESSFADGTTYPLPTPEESEDGDWIKYRNLSVTIPGTSMTFGSVTNGALMVNSRLTGLNAVGGTLAISIDTSTSDHHSVIFAGLANGAGG